MSDLWFFCTECGGAYQSERAAEACAFEDTRPDFHD